MHKAPRFGLVFDNQITSEQTNCLSRNKGTKLKLIDVNEMNVQSSLWWFISLFFQLCTPYRACCMQRGMKWMMSPTSEHGRCLRSDIVLMPTRKS